MKTLHVVFRVGDAEYVLPASDVAQMESFTRVTPVPGSNPWVAGLVQVRGQAIPLLDLRARFGLPPIAHTIDSRFIVVRTGGRTLALLADQARDVLRIEDSEFHPPPEVLARQSQGFVRDVAQAGKRLVLRIDLDRVIGNETLP
ncbi:MAG: chemotaxis protein CheW [Archangium gephyra]|uniref:Chemotaxis protein CheW n=1 Tax=Archangium gephyra TaxID=48 RepID=A0A2W5UFK6_9BACT|nr:MAG: chemotaxis protein CheW [Archangium gephyra]